MSLPGTSKQREKLCIECQLCCKLLAVPSGFAPDAQPEARAFFKVRGDATVIVNGILFVIVAKPCQHLTAFGCAIYHERPRPCREFNGLRDPIMRQHCKWKDINAEPVTKSVDIEDLSA
jgi:Fe-S-cluster containining protein